MNCLLRFIHFIFILTLLETLFLLSCTNTKKSGDTSDQGKKDDPQGDNDGTTAPVNIAGTWLTCGPVEDAEQNADNIYGCAYLNEDGTKTEENIDYWKVTIIGPDGQEFIITELKDADPNSKWNIIFTIPDELIGKMFDIKGMVSIHGSPQTTISSSCPLGYILAPGDEFYGTLDFCVMKYEAKYDEADEKKLPISKVDGSFYTGPDVTWEVAKAACESLGEKYSLINNEEWMTIAVNIAKNGANWSGSEVGKGFINQGHSDGWPNINLNATADNDPCFGTWNDNCNDPNHPDWRQKRTHVLSNNEIIWDLSGNVDEWVNKVRIDTKSKGMLSTYEFNKLTPKIISLDIGDIVPRTKTHPWWNDSWNSSQGLGNYTVSDPTWGGAFRRGFNYQPEPEEGEKAGIFYLNNAKSINSPGTVNTGFRCTVTK